MAVTTPPANLLQRHRPRTHGLPFWFLLLAVLVPARAAEIGYVETFSLAEDRARALEQLTPGTEDYYYYQALHSQNKGDRQNFSRVMDLWQHRIGSGERFQLLKRRQLLLDYSQDPSATYSGVQKELGLSFNHQRVDAATDEQIPSSWPAEEGALAERIQAILRQENNLEDLTDEGLSLLARHPLPVEVARQLLGRINRPDFPGLVKLVLQELEDRNTSGFGSLGAHQLLTAEQLQECSRARRNLRRDDRFIRAVLTRMRPLDQIDLATDREQKAKHLEGLLKFVRTLEPVHNNLKALVLYHVLKDAQAKGQYPRDVLREYLAVPRNVAYLARTLRDRALSAGEPVAELSASYEAETGLSPVQSDEDLVRDYLANILLDSSDFAGLDFFIDINYLRALQAQTRILAGDPATEKYAAVLSPQDFQRLRDRVDLEILPTNPTFLAPDDPVKLSVKVKNIKNLIVKAFEINSLNLYRETGQEVDQAIDLDGMVAAHEDNLTYDTPPLKSVLRTFEFPWMKGRGLWVVELVGNGKSSRAVIRKGQLRVLDEPSTAGTALRVIDETNTPVKDATIWSGKTEYTPDETGRIILPFSGAGGTDVIIIKQGEFASLARVQQRPENYTLQCGFHVERESLLEGHQAQLLVRPSLFLAGRPVSLKLLKDVHLTIEATDLDGVGTRVDVADIKLEDDRETVQLLSVPERLAQVRFVLRAKVDSMRENKPVDLEAASGISVNASLRRPATRDWFLRKNNGAYLLSCLGRNGEPIAKALATVTARPRAFRTEESQTLRTDAQGIIQLSQLADFTHITVNCEGDETRQWNLEADAVNYPGRITVAAGNEIVLPVLDKVDAILPQVSLLETIGGLYAHDRTSATKIENNAVHVTGLPPGRYSLLLRPHNRPIEIEVGPGPVVADHVLASREAIPATDAKYTTMSVAVEAKELVVKLDNAGEDTRVHVFATWTCPAFGAFADLFPAAPGEGLRTVLTQPESMYVSGRTVGDEYRYVLERRYAAKHPGVMLTRPGLVLTPWALRDSSSAVQEANTGDQYSNRQQNIAAALVAASPATPVVGSARTDAESLEFLGTPAVIMPNLRPTDGVLRIPLADLPPDVRLLVTSRNLHLERHLSLKADTVPTRDRRLAKSLDPARSFATTKLASSLRKDKGLEIVDRLSSRVRGFGTLREVYELLTTLCSDQRLADFRFAMDWPALSTEEKHKKYSEFASHELNFYLSRKDPEFFKTVVKPYIANKHEKTFLDHYLLDDDLKRYLDPWPYAQLNAVEKILLARRTGHLEALRRQLDDQSALRNADHAEWDRLFASALNTGSLAGDQGVVVMSGKKEAKAIGAEELGEGAPAVEMAADAPAAAPPPPPPMPSAAPAGEASSEPEAQADSNGGLVNLTKSYVDKLSRMAPADREKLQSSIQKYAPGPGAPRQSLARDFKSRARVRQLYRGADKTKELVETHYYHRPIQEQVANLVQLNDFWLDYAKGDEDGFLSGRFPHAARNATEAMFVLSVLDLPFSAPKVINAVAGAGLKVSAGGNAIVFHQEVKEASRATGKARVLVSQDFYRADARHRMVDGQEVDNFVTDEFLAGRRYACDVVLTNPGSLPVELDVLLQVPEGSIALDGGKQTGSIPVRLEPYNSYKPTYTFYFPKSGDFAHHPVEVAHRGAIIARAEPFKFHVVDQLTHVDQTSWEEISQHGTTDQVLAFLANKSLERLDLTKIAFRMHEKEVFTKTTETLRNRGVFDSTLWSYGIFHNDLRTTREYLETSALTAKVGPYIESPLLNVNPVERGTYQHFDYDPLIHARAHTLGSKRQILNPQAYEEYHRFLDILAHKPVPTDRDWLEVAYFLLLQDRVDEGLQAFDRVHADKIDAKVQFDYMRAITLLLKGDVEGARKAVTTYATHPVPRWQERFAELLAQTGTVDTPKATTRDQAQDRLASTEPSLDLDIDAKLLRVSHRTLASFTVNYYKMDVELLFSRSPFVHDQSSRYSYVRPALSEVLKTEADQPVTKHMIPDSLQNTDLVVEVVSGGLRASRPYFASSLAVQLIENYGQLEVSHMAGLSPRPIIYVKVFARMKDGTVRFYKDGYADHRQRFDYATLSTDDLDQVDRFAILVMSDKFGAVVREASPPKK